MPAHRCNRRSVHSLLCRQATRLKKVPGCWVQSCPHSTWGLQQTFLVLQPYSLLLGGHSSVQWCEPWPLSWFLFCVLENCISLGCWLQWFVFLLVWKVQDVQCGCFRCSRRVCRKNSSCPGELQCKSSPCKGTVSVHWNIYLICRLRVFHILNWCQKLWPKQYLELVVLEEGCVLQQIWET